MNRLIADILRCFVNHKQDNWAALLPICEYAINYFQQASTGNSPFFLNYGFNPKVPADFILVTGARRTRPDWIQARSDALKKAQDSIVAAQARQALYADRGRNPSRPKVGDLALVYRDFLISPEARQQPSRKLQPKWFGPFCVVGRGGGGWARTPTSWSCRSFSAVILYSTSLLCDTTNRKPFPTDTSQFPLRSWIWTETPAIWWRPS